MRLAAALALLAIVAPHTQTREAGPRPSGTAVLGGRVVHDGTAVARAVVTLDTGDGRADRQTLTDDDGRFAFERLPAGRFLLTASKPGWVTSFYGSARPGRPPGVRVAVADAARADVEIPILPGAVIAGRVIDESGRPMARQFPWLLEYRTIGDRRLLTRARPPSMVGYFERMTDDRGQFRLFGLPPGTYYLVTTPTIAAGARIATTEEVRWATQTGESGIPPPPPGAIAGYASVFHPGTTDPAGAQPIVVGAGDVREDVDIRVGFVPVARLTGVVTLPDGTPARATLTMKLVDSPISLEGMNRRVTASPDGRFTFQNVPPGTYVLAVRAASDSTPAFWGEATVTVAGQDQNMGIALVPASVVTGRVAFAGTSLAPPADLTRIRVQLIDTESLVSAMTGAAGPGTVHSGAVASDGSFTVPGLTPGRYVAAATWPGMRTGDGTAGWWLTSIRAGDRDLGDAPIDVPAGADVRAVTLTFSDRIGAIEGVLVDAIGRPAPEHFVMAFPVDRTSWTPGSRRIVAPVRPGTDGRFRLAGLPAGEYHLAVVTAVEPDDAADPAFLEAILPGAITVTVADGETLRQDLRIGR
ncbi:MAG TPA: carboxypeptidase-like regulatory domain-containing protein [Vicinamibacterales bacterium]|nr:carboxypeptidase-like regulatory domain-containing protein [Vicinamibacterales bacterium]